MPRQLKYTIPKRENERVEFKTSFNDASIETLTAFANTKGGSVFVGIDNNGKPIEGFTIGEETIQKWLNDIKNKTSPSIIPDVQTFVYDGHTYVEIKINEFPIKPVSFKGRYFKRARNSNHLLSLSEISNLHLQSLQSSWDSYPNPDGMITDIDFEKVERFIRKVNYGGRFFIDSPVQEALEKLSLLKNGQLTNAAILLFAKKELNYTAHVGRFKTPSLIIDDKIIKGSLFEVVEEIMRYIIGQIKVAFDISGIKTQRDEIFEYPIPALRELVLNAVVHRDYTSPIDIQIKIFDNSITFFNPGKLYGDLTIEDLHTDKYQSHARNKLIAEAFYLTKDIEKYGSGYIRIRNEIKDYPTMMLSYQEIGNGFFSELSYTQQKISNNVTNDVTKDVAKDVTKDEAKLRREKIISLIKTHTNITANQIAEQLNINRRTVLRDMDKLKTAKQIQRVGGRKEGYWKVIE